MGPRAPGVVGKQPVLRPGQSFSYVSGCPLSTSFGTMHGSFEMSILEPTTAEDGRPALKRTGEYFDAIVDRFGLTVDGRAAVMPQIVIEADFPDTLDAADSTEDTD